MDEQKANDRWHRAAHSRFYLELAGLSFALMHGHQPEDYAQHLWSLGAAKRVGKARPSPTEYLRQEAEAIAVLWPGLDFHLEEGEGLTRLVFTRGCLGAGWGQPWALAGRLGLAKEQVCRYCKEAFRVWGEQLGLSVLLSPEEGGPCTLKVASG